MLLFALLILLACPRSVQSCNRTVGVYSIASVATTAAPFYNVSNLCVQLFNQSTTFLQAVATKQVDYSYCTPTLNNCLLSQYSLTPVAGYITNGSITISGDILVNQESPFNTLQSLRGSRLICGLPYITAVFQLQAAAFAEANFFAYFSVIRFESNQTTILQELASGTFDVAFFRSDQVDIFWTGNFFQQFKVLDSHLQQGEPFVSSTPAYPEWEVLAQTYVPTVELKELYNQLAASPMFGPPYNYRPYLQLLQDLQLVAPNGTCLVTSETDIYPYITCPRGGIKLTASLIQNNCAAFTDQCTGASCICKPCFIPVTALLLGLEPLPFWSILFATILTFWAASWTLQTFRTGEDMVPRVSVESIVDVVDFVRFTTGTLMQQTTAVPIRMEPAFQQKHPSWSQRAVWQRIADSCRITHPNIVQTYGVTKRHNGFWIVQSVYTSSLWDAMRQQPNQATLLRMARETASGLQRIHGDNLLQRVTLKNVVVDREGHAQLRLTAVNQARTQNSADDIGCFGWLLLNLLKDADLGDMVRQCMHSNPKLRPSITQVLIRLIATEQHVQSSHLELLNSILPPFVSESLAQGQQVGFKLHPAVAIIFTDIVGFTSICSSLHPAAIGSLLVRLYRAFDTLAMKYSIYKQEIVGDCWVGATNLVSDQSADYAARMVTFGGELVAVARSTEIVEGQGQTVVVRVGIHVGTVVAGVVGETNPKFCMFGDPMNTAARMESTSLPGRIHLSQAAADAVVAQSPGLGNFVAKREGGPVEVKGKGPMTTYWMN